MTKVVTLPIKPSCGGPFLKVFTSFVGDVVSKSLKCDFAIMNNLNGLIPRGGIEYSQDKYKEILQKLNITGYNNLSLYSDDSDEYESFVNKQIQTLIDTGVVNFKMMNILSCPCGKVEIPYVALLGSNSQTTRKTLIKKDSDSGSYICSDCSGVLAKKEEEVAILNFVDELDNEIYPSILRDEMIGICRKYIKNGLVISRKNKREFVFGDKQFGLDSDFRWSLYLGYIAGNDTDLNLVVGRPSLIHAVRVLMISKILYPDLNVKLIVHPRVKINDINGNLSSSSIEDFIENNADYRISRSFLSLGLNWSQPQAVINSSELFFINKMFGYRTIDEVKIDTQYNIQNIIDKINKDQFKDVFDKIKKDEKLDDDQKNLMGILYAKF